MRIQDELFARQDIKYADFHSRLIPGVPRETIIGVRVPALRRLAAAYIKEAECEEFLHTLPHIYYDENMLHGLLISRIKDYEECIKKVDAFLPYVDNWAVCDTMSPKVFKTNRDKLLPEIMAWSASEHTYTCRFGIEMLMVHFLEEDFKEEYLRLPAKSLQTAQKQNDYYVKMMVAWFYATALAKQWEATIPYLENGCLEKWTHNKTIQKARESFRITSECKQYLASLKK